MKYMGSKRAMLKNGLGEILLREAEQRSQVVDLFSGSGAVASFIARNVSVPVAAYDLQAYSCVLAGAVLERTCAADHDRIWRNWKARAVRYQQQILSEAVDVPASTGSARSVLAARRWCELNGGPICNAYGGHYFSPEQAIWIDSLRATIGDSEPARTLSLAALLDAASECAASPGHTAQPFQPTSTARRFLHEAWERSVPERCKEALVRLSAQFARTHGTAEVADANQAAKRVGEGDLVFVDPPYSALQYSRFYHVLESIAQGFAGPVEGVGRYPLSDRRPKSDYSVKSRAATALKDLLSILSRVRADVILTFPDHPCSNGLSGASIKTLAEQYFGISEVAVKSRLSTLGGAGADCIVSEKRGARRDTSELILMLRAK